MSVAVLGRDGQGTWILVNALRREFELARVVLERPEPQRVFLARRARRLGALRVADQVLFRTLAMPLLERVAAARLAEIAREHGLDATPPGAELVTRVESANDPATVRLLRELGSDIVVLSGPRILAPHVLGDVPATFVNVHAGVTPLYRGVHGGYWALVRGDRENCGVTVHLVDEGIDTGGILAQARIEPTERDTFVTYPRLQLAAGLPLLVRAIHDVRAGRPELQPPPEGESRLWTHPTLTEYLRNRRRLGVK